MNHYVNETEIYPVFPSTVTTSLPEAVHPKCVIRGVILKCPGTISSDPFRWVLFAIISITGFAYTPTQFRNIPHGYLGREHVNGFADNNTLYISSQGYAVGECYLTIKYTKK